MDMKSRDKITFKFLLLSKFLLVLIFSILTFPTFGQSNELSFHLTSGLFSYNGSSATNSTVIYISDTGGPDYTSNPFGRKSGFSFGFLIQFQRITKSNLIYGLQTGYESLSSKVKLDEAIGEIAFSVDQGKTILTNQFLNFFPFIGKRFRINKQIEFDVFLGTDIAQTLSTRENSTIRTNLGDIFKTSLDFNKEYRNFPINKSVNNWDLRSRIGITGYYKKLGLTLGYSQGLVDHANGMVDFTGNIYSRIFRMGFVYKVN